MSDYQRTHDLDPREETLRMDTPESNPVLRQPSETGEQDLQVQHHTGEFAAAFDAIVQPDFSNKSVVINGELISYKMCNTESLGVTGLYTFMDNKLWLSDRVEPLARAPLAVFAVLFETGKYTPKECYKRILELGVTTKDNTLEVMHALHAHFSRISTDGATSVDDFMSFLNAQIKAVESYDSLQ